MVFWVVAVTVSAVVCIGLYYASGSRAVNASAAERETSVDDGFRERLLQIESDVAEGRLTPADGVAAKAELAREILRVGQGRSAATPTRHPAARTVALVSSVAAAALALGIYAAIGHPELPAQPLVARADLPGTMTLADAVARIEGQMEKTPEDVRGWAALAPAYLQLERVDDAVAAYRRIVELSPPSADAQSDLAEALMIQNDGDAAGEPLALFESAAALDPTHARSRFYLAGEATRSGQFEVAATRWQELLRLSQGDEPWLAAAEAGYRQAVAGLNGRPVPNLPAAQASEGVPDEEAIRGMVDGLDARLAESGGSVEEWARLVRSRLVLGETEKAQAAYDRALAAFPDAAGRGELDEIARQAGLATSGAPVP